MGYMRMMMMMMMMIIIIIIIITQLLTSHMSVIITNESQAWKNSHVTTI